MFFSVLFFFFFKPKLFFQHLFESLLKQQLRGILLNMYVFKLMNFTKLCSLLGAFVNTQETFQRCSNVAVRVIWRRDVRQCHINVEATLCMSKLKFITLNNVKSTLSISTLILTTLDNVETMPAIFNIEFHNIDQRRNKVVNMTIFKKLNRAKKYFRASKKKDNSFD